MKFVKKFLYIFAILFLVTSCGGKVKTEQRVDDNVYWALGNINQTVEDAAQLTYEPLELSYNNISDKLGPDPAYVWVKIKFTINENLKNKPLGMVIPYLHFSEKAWLNGAFLGQYGEFEPRQYSVQYQAHFYALPQELLNQSGENEVYIKLFSFGTGTISDGITIDEYAKASRTAALYTFACSKVYLFFSGILFCAFLLFFIFYFARKEKNMLNFAMICLTSFVFLSFYNAPEMPYYGSVSWAGTFLFTKVIQCCFFYFTMYAIVTFILTFVGVGQSKQFVIFKRTVVAITVIITLAMPDYSSLSKICVPMIITYLLHFLLGISSVVKSLFDKEKRKKARIAARGFSPMVITLMFDLLIRHIFRNINFPYFVLFGLVFTIVYFIVYFSIDYGLVYGQNQRLTDDLRREVELQTVDLTLAKEKLELEVEKSERDMQMAAIVQENFFTKPPKQFLGWNHDIAYEPLDKVSGDLFDFYSDDGEKLKGFSLFDASGHGVAAALVTMLSKNIIHRYFNRAYENYFPISYALGEINDEIIAAKGDVENYLTGIMVRFTDLGDSCKVELASAGHPYPIVYDSELKECISLKDMENGPHYGAIGLAGFEVAFCNIQFQMKPDDIMLCFSDGLTEISDKDNNEFGRARLEKIIRENADLSANDLLSLIKKQVMEFIGEAPKEDDITVILLKKVNQLEML